MACGCAVGYEVDAGGGDRGSYGSGGGRDGAEAEGSAWMTILVGAPVIRVMASLSFPSDISKP